MPWRKSFRRYPRPCGEPRTRWVLHVDFGTDQPMPLAAMRHQCEVGLRWLREGQVEGPIFLATNLCDLELDAVEWTLTCGFEASARVETERSVPARCSASRA